jgi:hypothetical protein
VRPPGMMTCQGGAGQAGLMSLEGLSGLVNRVFGWADRLQRKHGVLGFPYAVVKKYGDDEGGRQAALITYCGFLSIFPVLLPGVAVLSRVLAGHPDLRQRLITAIMPQALRPRSSIRWPPCRSRPSRWWPAWPVCCCPELVWCSRPTRR